MRGTGGDLRQTTADDIEGAVRFFVFAAEPDPAQLVRVGGAAGPVPPRKVISTKRDAVLFGNFSTKTEPAGSAHRKEIL